MGRPPLDAIPWYLHKIEVASENLQNPEGRRMAEEGPRYVLASYKESERRTGFDRSPCRGGSNRHRLGRKRG